MPPVNVAGQPRKSMTEPSIENDDKGLTAPIPAKEVAKVAIPEPALTAADHVPPSQEELAALSIVTQNVTKKNLMTPSTTSTTSTEPAYKFTDSDRKVAVAERWKDKYDWDESELDEALANLAYLRAEVERGGIALQKRISELKVERVKCFGCENIINLSDGRYATYRTRNNFETGIPESAYACSAACGLKLNRDFGHPVRIPQPMER